MRVVDWTGETGGAGGVHHDQLLEILFLAIDALPFEGRRRILWIFILVSGEDWYELQ